MDSSAPAARRSAGQPGRPPVRRRVHGGRGRAAGYPVRRQRAYVLLAQTDRPNADFLVLPTVHGGLSKQDPTGAFAVHGNTVDVRDRVSFGANGYFLLQGVLRTVDGQGYGSVSLAADGDLRFLRGAVADGMTILATPGSVALAGARIYPRRKHGPWWNRATTASVSRLCCPEWARTSRRPIRPSASCPSPRRASITARRCGPLGNLSLNAEQLSLLPGSLTSVSARGLVMPYGGTVDGVAYAYGGKPVVPNRPGEYGKIALSGKLDAAPGSRIDLSGGGELLGAAFVSGRGGSSDARYTPLMRIDPAGGGFSLPGLATNPVYAVVPGAQATVAPTAAEGRRGAPLIGRQIQIGAGVPGLSAGTYADAGQLCLAAGRIPGRDRRPRRARQRCPGTSGAGHAQWLLEPARELLRRRYGHTRRAAVAGDRHVGADAARLFPVQRDVLRALRAGGRAASRHATGDAGARRQAAVHRRRRGRPARLPGPGRFPAGRRRARRRAGAARHRDRGAGRWRGRHAWHEQLLRQHAQRLRRVAHQRGRSGPQLRHRRRQCADVRVAGSQRHVAGWRCCARRRCSCRRAASRWRRAPPSIRSARVAPTTTAPKATCTAPAAAPCWPCPTV